MFEIYESVLVKKKYYRERSTMASNLEELLDKILKSHFLF